MREAWTDGRLDDLNHRVDEGFNRVDTDLRELRSEMNARFDAMDARFDAMHRMLIQVGGGMLAALSAALIALLASHL